MDNETQSTPVASTTSGEQERLLGLVEHWEKIASDLDEAAERMEYQTLRNLYGDRADTFRRCANDLKANLDSARLEQEGK